MIRSLFCFALQAYYIILFVRIIWSWFPPPRSGPLRIVYELVLDLTEPVLKLVRGLVPPIRMGAAGLDLSPIVIFIVITVLQASVCRGIGVLS